jgi:hypothetical protein
VNSNTVGTFNGFNHDSTSSFTASFEYMTGDSSNFLKKTTAGNTALYSAAHSASSRLTY